MLLLIKISRYRCDACYAPEDVGKLPPDWSHRNSDRHISIMTTSKKEIDLGKIKPQDNDTDRYYVQGEEYDRMNKLNKYTRRNCKPWLDWRFFKWDYEYYCEWCEEFVGLSIKSVEKHAKLAEHRQKFHQCFRVDLESLLVDSEFLQKRLLQFSKDT